MSTELGSQCLHQHTKPTHHNSLSLQDSNANRSGPGSADGWGGTSSRLQAAPRHGRQAVHPKEQWGGVRAFLCFAVASDVDYMYAYPMARHTLSYPGCLHLIWRGS